MKKLVFLLLGFATLVAEPFTKQIQLARAVDSTTSSTTSVPTTQTSAASREVDASLFDYKSYGDGGENASKSLPGWQPDLLTKDAPMGSVAQLNYTANALQRLKVKDSLDILSSFIEEDVEYVLNDEQNLTFLKLANANNENYYCSFFYQHLQPIIYFDTSLKEKQNISMYLDLGWIREDFSNLKKQFPLLSGTLPLFIVNDEYTFLEIEFTDSSWKIKSKNYARVEPYYDPYHSKLVMKMTIPYLYSITDIKVFSSKSFSAESDAKKCLPDSSFIFAFDKVLNDRYYFYHFDICSLSVLNKCLVVDNSTYSSYTHIDGSYHEDDMTADFVSMKVRFTGTKKEENSAIKKSLAKPTGNPYIYTPILPKEIDLYFDRNIGYVDGKVRYWFFDDFDLEENVSGVFKILSISFHPYILINGRYDIDESTTLTHHYENANIHKYSFNADKGIRTYYYKMSSYFRAISKNAAWYEWLGYVIFADPVNNYICFGFDFYFDKARRFPIPNVKNITIKYQRGYKEPNPDPDSNGFYPNCGDPDKDIKVRTLEVSDKHPKIGAIDNDGLILSNNAPKAMMTDNNKITHDYVIYQYRRRGSDPGITTMDALEITYETQPGEMVRMVGNSKGLHVVVDSDGVARVYNSEGNLEEDYGVHESTDGTLVPGQDLNGDGKIESDEVINSDTGIKEYAPFEDDSTWLSKFVDSIDNLFTKNSARTISTIVVIALVVVAIIFIPKLLTKKRR